MSLLEKFNQFRIRSSWTLLVPTLCLSVLLLAVGILAAWQLDRIQTSASQAVAFNVSSMRASEELEIALREVRSQLNYYLLTKDRTYLSDLGERRSQVSRWMTEARRYATTTVEQDQISRIDVGYQRLSKDFDRLTALASEAGNDDEIEQLGRALALDEMRGMLSAAHEYLDFNENAIMQSSERNQTLTSRLVPTLSLLGICGAVAGILMGFVIARGIRRQVVECNVLIRDVEGKLNEVLGPLTVTSTMDLDGLEPTLRQVADRVQHVVRRLQDSERETLRSEQLAAVGQLAAGMAHELRNPLTSMKVLVQSSLMDDQPLLEGHDLEILEEEIERMAVLIDSFLNYARPPQLEKRPLDLVEVCQRTVSLILPRATQKEIQLTLQMPKRSLLIEADSRQLRQVLLNLFENSLDATPIGGRIWIELYAASSLPQPITIAPWLDAAEQLTAEMPVFSTSNFRLDRPSREPVEGAASNSNRLSETHSVFDRDGNRKSTSGIHILIADSGRGIPPELGDRIFLPFVSTKETGLGLGLSICRRIVQSHGGQIVGNNLTGGGTAFSIWLPLSDEGRCAVRSESLLEMAN